MKNDCLFASAAKSALAFVNALDQRVQPTVTTTNDDDDDDDDVFDLSEFPIHASDPTVYRLARAALQSQWLHSPQAATLLSDLHRLIACSYTLTRPCDEHNSWQCAWHAVDGNVFELRERIVAHTLKRLDVGLVLLSSADLPEEFARFAASVSEVLAPELIRPSWNPQLTSRVLESVPTGFAQLADTVDALTAFAGADREHVRLLTHWLSQQSALDEVRAFAATEFRGASIERRLWPSIESAVRARSTPPSVLVVGGIGWTARQLVPLCSKVTLWQSNALLAAAALERCNSASSVTVLNTLDPTGAKAFDMVVLVGWHQHGLVGRMLQLVSLFDGRDDVTVLPRTLHVSASLALQDTLQDVCGIDFQLALSPLMGLGETTSSAVSRHPTDAPHVVVSAESNVCVLNVHKFAAVRRRAIELELLGDASELNCVVWSTRTDDGVLLNESVQLLRHVQVSGRPLFTIEFNATRNHVWFDDVPLSPDVAVFSCPWATQFVAQWHFQMLRDSVRNEAFNEAIRRRVAGRRVLDAGAGPTALLSQFAARGGAAHCTAIEIVPHVYRLAQRCIETSRLTERIELHNADAMLFAAPAEAARADMLVAELLDAAGVGEHFVAVVRSARQRLLGEHAAVMPARLRLIAQPIELGSARVLESELLSAAVLSADAGAGQYAGIRFDGSDGVTQASGAWRALAPEQTVFDFDFERDSLEMPVDRVVEFVVTANVGSCNAVMWWFDAWLDRDGERCVTNAPSAARVTHWAQAAALLPTRQYVAGQTIALAARSDGKTVRWTSADSCSNSVAGGEMLDMWRQAERRCDLARRALSDVVAGECASDAARLATLQRAALAVCAQPELFGVDIESLCWLKKSLFS